MTRLLHHWVTEQAQRRPDAPAVMFENSRLTYGELEAASNRLAHLLRAQGCRRGDRICLLIPKSPVALIALLAALKTDAMYVPLDVASPAPRLAKILRACDTDWVLAAGGVGPLLDALAAQPEVGGRVSVGWLELEAPETEVAPRFLGSDLAGCPVEPPTASNGPGDSAHVLFTSGSTGTPKGVVITHANVIHFVRWATAYFGITDADRISGHPPLHFDLSTFDIFGTFAAGATLYLVPPQLNLLAPKLAAFIRDCALTQWFSVPSLFSYLAKFDALRANDFPALRRALWCGEVMPVPTLAYWMARLPHATFTNLYGPTEATIASSYYTVPRRPLDEREAIPIGTACPGEELLVLDDELRPVPPGDVGNLFIRGAGLSPGYWGDEEKTRAAFLPNPHGADPGDRIYRTGDLARVGEDGLVYFLGRADTQIKSRGYRIELGEIETALHALAPVGECAVVALASSGFEGAVICCAYVLRHGAAISPTGLRAELARVLPAYMLPTRWQALEELPKNANGKIDRPRLRELFQPAPAGAP